MSLMLLYAILLKFDLIEPFSIYKENGVPAVYMKDRIDTHDYKPRFLFEIDTVKMYKFYDHGWHYFGIEKHNINIDYEKQPGDQ
jgi:hypothetical protein